VTLATGDSGNVDAGSNGSAITLIDAGQNFLTTVKIGDIVYNSTQGEWAVVVAVVSDTELTHTPLSNGATWATNDAYATNVVPVALVDADTVWFPYMDRIATVNPESINITYAADRDVVARDRWAGASPILPFEQTGIDIDSAGLTVAAIRNDDEIKE